MCGNVPQVRILFSPPNKIHGPDGRAFYFDKIVNTQMKRLFAVIVVTIIVFIAAVPPASLNSGLKSVESETPKPVKIGFIGDSITVGAVGNYNAVQNEMDELGSRYSSVNRGVDGATSADWVPGKPYYDSSFSIFKSEGVHVVSIMLGTNDANHDVVPPDQYYENMRKIVTDLIVSGQAKYVIINYPPYSVKTDKLPEYAKQLDKLVNGATIIKGDTAAYSYFQKHQKLLSDGVHPTDEGYKQLGILWAKAFKHFLMSHHL